MSGASWILVGVSMLVAAIDWWAVAGKRKPVEYVAKPGVMAALIVLALTVEGDGALTVTIVIALALSALGDTFLMLPSDRFLQGLVSFLAAHVAYIVAFLWVAGTETSLAVALVPVAVVAAVLGSRLVTGPRMPSAMRAPVVAYVCVIALMAAAAIASGSVLAAIGAVLFMASDSMIGWRRFVVERPWMPLAIIVSYHIGQLFLTLSLTQL